MLNRDLLRYRFRNRKFSPVFVEVSAPPIQESAAALIGIYAEAAASGLRRCELEELTSPAVKGAFDPKLAAGLEKLLSDRTEFSPAGEEDFPALRRNLFAVSGRELAAARGDMETFHRRMTGLGAFRTDLYGDLPDFERLRSFREITPEALLCRYNLAQVQGLLIYAKELEITASCSEPAELRRLLKFMKFFRLLAELSFDGKEGVKLVVSGPFSLFDGAKKYALQLASFFPAVAKLPRWTLRASVDLNGKQGELQLDQSAGLVSHYRNISAYIPEEIRLYHRLFAEKSAEWKIVGDAPFINGGGGEMIFPDLSFRSPTGKTVHLELFHRWHRAPFEKRLAWLEKQKKYNFIIGADRAVADDDTFAAIAEKFPRASEKIFRFRDFPGVETTLRMLQKLEKEKRK